MPPTGSGIFRLVGLDEGAVPADGPFFVDAPKPSNRTFVATMTKEQLQRLQELSDKVQELRGYL